MIVRAFYILSLIFGVWQQGAAESVTIPVPECEIRAAVTDNLEWYDLDNELSEQERAEHIPFLIADQMYSNRLVERLVRIVSDQIIETEQNDFDRSRLKQTFVNFCQSWDLEDPDAEFDFAFEAGGFVEQYFYASLGSYLLNTKFRPDMARPYLERKYSFKPLYLWEKRLSEPDEDIDSSIDIFYRLHANRAKLALFLGQSDIVELHARRYLDLIGTHKNHNNDWYEPVTDPNVTFNLLKTLKSAGLLDQAFELLDYEANNGDEMNSYLSELSTNETENIIVKYQFLWELNLAQFGEEGLSKRMQYESLMSNVGYRHLMYKSVKTLVLQSNKDRLNFAKIQLPDGHAMVLRETFHDEIYELLGNFIIQRPDNFLKMPSNELRAYLKERERRIQNREPLYSVDLNQLEALDSTLSKWSDRFATRTDISDTDKNQRQNEIEKLRAWVEAAELLEIERNKRN